MSNLIERLAGLTPEKQAYTLQMLVAHLEGAGQFADVHYLLAMATKEQRNAWYEVKDAYLDLEGYLADVTRAWEIAERVNASIGLQCRYALIVASMKSLAGNIPPALLAALVDKNVWTPIQGSAYARQIPVERQRAEALVDLAPHLSGPQMQEALAVARTIESEGYLEHYLKVLIALAPHLSPSLQTMALQEALTMARTIRDEGQRAKALIALAPHLSEPSQLQEALALARTIKSYPIENGYWQAEVLTALAPHLSESQLPEALAAAWMIGDGYRRAEALMALFPHLSPSLQTTVLQEALAATPTMYQEERRAKVLIALAPHLSRPLQTTVLQEALAVTRTIWDVWGGWPPVLTALAPHLSEPQLQEALAVAWTIEHEQRRAKALIALAPYLSKSQLPEALALARTIGDEGQRVEALTALAPHLSRPLQTTVLQEALTMARTIGDEGQREKALTALAPHLSEPSQLQEALALARTIKNGYLQAEALTALAPYLSEPQLQEALALARTIGDKEQRVEALTALAPHLSESQLQEALTTARTIGDKEQRVKSSRQKKRQWLSRVARTIRDDGQRVKALAVTRTIGSEGYLAEHYVEVLTALAPYLFAPFHNMVLHEAYAAARSIDYLGDREKALAAARSIGSERYLATCYLEALMVLAPHLSKSQLQETLALARTIGYGEEWAKVLTALAPYLSEPQLQEALALARTIKHEEERAEVLTALAPHLSPSLQTMALQEALTIARTIRDEGQRVKELTALALHVKQLPVISLYSLWCEILHILATGTRSNLLLYIQTLAPVIAALGGKEALAATAQAIIEVGKWFP